MSIICPISGGQSQQDESLDIQMNCTAAEAIGDAVYVSANNEVRQANNSDISTAKVLGFIVSKQSATTCKVRIAGLLSTLSGLTIGSQYFLASTNGKITTTPTTVSGSVLVRLGQAINATELRININNDYILRS